MDISRKHLDTAASQGVITTEQAERLWLFLAGENRNRPGFHLTHILYYLGGLIAIGAMSLFMTLGWEHYGGWGICAIALCYAVVGLALTEYFLKRDLRIPAQLLGAFVVALTPLAVFGLQKGLGFWVDDRPYRDYHVFIDWNWLLMELATLAAGAVMLWRYRLPFLLMPVAVTLWYMSMDLTPFLFQDDDAMWSLRRLVSLWFGLGMTLVAFWVDVRSRRREDFAFWLYLFGVIAFWGGLSSLDSNSELNKFLYCCINLAMILVGATLSRRIFAVFGGLGVAGYLGHLSWSVFKESMLFPFALTAIGLGVIGAGILWQRHEAELTRKLRTRLPAALREMLANRS